MGSVVRPLIKDDVSHAPADHHPKNGRPGNEVPHLIGGHLRVTLLREAFINPVPAQKGHDVSESIPTKADVISNPEDKRAEIIDIISEQHGEPWHRILWKHQTQCRTPKSQSVKLFKPSPLTPPHPPDIFPE